MWQPSERGTKPLSFAKSGVKGRSLIPVAKNPKRDKLVDKNETPPA